MSGLAAAERAELEELRIEKERLWKLNEDLRTEKTRLSSQVTELQNQNAQLIEDHTRDMLSIKAKETQLVRARSDAETAEQTVQKQLREIERLKRELARAVRASTMSPPVLADGLSTGISDNGPLSP
jgi:cytoskeleton-associated protein 5